MFSYSNPEDPMSPKVEAMLNNPKLISALAFALGAGKTVDVLARELADRAKISLDDAKGLVYAAEAELDAKLNAGLNRYQPLAKAEA